MKKIFLILTSVSLLAGMGCKKGYLDVNVNPNQSTSADPSLVLPGALTTTVAQWYPGPTAHSEWMQSWAISGSFAISSTDATTYKMTTAFGESLWSPVYDNLEDYQYVQTSAAASGQQFLEGVARIMKVYQFHHLVDVFNDVPYTDALKGALSLRPTYSKGMVIYDSLFNELQKGITLVKNSGITVGANSDVMFAGDKTKWIQFANTVRLRMLLRMSELQTKPDYFQKNVDLTKNESAGFLTTDALVQPGYSNAGGKGNPFWQRFYDLNGGQVSSFGDFWAANAFAVSFYKSTNDPRISREYSPVKGTTDTYVGNTLGLTNGNPVNGKYSVFGPGVLVGPAAPAVMMLAAESYFLQAEGQVLGYIPGAAVTSYDQGIKESFRYLKVEDTLKKVATGADSILTTDQSAETYYSQPGNSKTNFSTATTVLAQQTIILRQKWAALNSINSFEAWSDYRRFDYLHTGTPPFAGPLGDTPLSASPFIDVPKIPLRYKYPASEYAKNPDNVNAEGNIDHQTGKIFWIR